MPKDTFNNLPEEKRNHILEIAINEFAANPYDVASISNIVRKAGIAKGSFYQYFEDKKDLYRTLIEISTDKKQALLTELPSPSPWSDLFNYLRWQFLSTVIFEIRYPDLFTNHLPRVCGRSALPRNGRRVTAAGNHTIF